MLSALAASAFTFFTGISVLFLGQTGGGSTSGGAGWPFAIGGMGCAVITGAVTIFVALHKDKPTTSDAEAARVIAEAAKVIAEAVARLPHPAPTGAPPPESGGG